MSFLTASEFLLGAVLPAFVVTVLCLLVGGRKDPFRGRVQSILFALGYSFSIYYMLDHLDFPPQNARQVLPWGAIALAIFVAVSPHATASRYMTRALFTVGL